MKIVIFVLIAIFILLLAYIGQPRTEKKLEENFDEFIKNELHEIYCESVQGHACFKDAKEVDLSQSLQLDDKTQLIVFGIDHRQTLRCPWALYLVTKQDDNYLIHPDIKGNFWLQKFVKPPGTNSKFEIQEVIWSNKQTITARGFLVPLPTPDSILKK